MGLKTKYDGFSTKYDGFLADFMYLFGRFLHMASTVGTQLYKMGHFEVFFYEIVTFLSSLYQYVGHRYIKIPMDC